MQLGLEAGKETLNLASELGFGGVPVNAESLVSDGVEATLAPLRKRNLSVCQIGAFGYNPLRPDPKQRATLEAAIPLAAETGCPYIVIGGGNYHPDSFGGTDARNYEDAALEEIAGALQPLLDRAEQHHAYLSIEPILKGAICSPERFLALHCRVNSSALRCNIDPSSLYDYHDLLNSDRIVDRVCDQLAGHYGLVHLKEVALADGFHLHAGLAPLGQGNTNWTRLLKNVAPHLPPDSWVILEHVQNADEARASTQLLQRAARDAGVTLSKNNERVKP